MKRSAPDRSAPSNRRASWPLLLLGGLAAAAIVVAIVRRESTPDRGSETSGTSQTGSAGTSSSVTSAAGRMDRVAFSSAVTGPSSREEWLATLREKLAREDGLALVANDLEMLARQNPRLAIELAQTLGRNPEERYTLTASAVRGWASNEPETAWQWALNEGTKLEYPGEPSFGAVIMLVAAVKDPDLVLDWVREALASIPEGSNRDVDQVGQDAVNALLQAGHRQLARDAVDSWANGVSGASLGNAVYELAAHQGEESPEEAAAWLRSLPESDGRNYALGTIAAIWSMQDPAAAMTWAFSLNEADARLDVMQRAFNRWADRDIVAAGQWLSDHEADPAIDQMIATLVSDSSLTYNNPRVALVWATTIADPDLRIRSMEPVVSSWSRQDREGALRYLNENTSLGLDEKERLLRAIHESANPPSADAEW